MKSRGNGGSIVNVSSVVGIYAVSNYSVYAATKGAVQALTISMALEFGPYQAGLCFISFICFYFEEESEITN